MAGWWRSSGLTKIAVCIGNYRTIRNIKTMIDTPTKHKFTVNSLVLMEETGVLPPNHRTELLNGELIDMSPIKASHAYCVTQLTRFFYQHLPTDQYVVSVQTPCNSPSTPCLNPTCW